MGDPGQRYGLEPKRARSSRPDRWAWPRAALPLVLFAAGGCNTDLPGPARVDPAELALQPVRFRNCSLQGRSYDPVIPGNTLDALVDGPRKGVRTAEVDFALSADGVLVAAHDDEIGGSCPTVSASTLDQLRQCRLEGGHRVATLEDFLRHPYREYFLDLKDTGPGDPARAARALDAAVDAIARADRRERAVVMLYDDAPELVERLRGTGIRGGLKGYPESEDEVLAMARRAAHAGLEMVCVELEHVTPRVLHDSARWGVWHLAWYTGSRNVDLWSRRAAAGLGGLITGYHPLVAAEVAPHWRPLEPTADAAALRAGVPAP